MYVYEEWKGESSYMYSVLLCQLDWLCLMINQVQIDRMHFPMLSIIQDERRGRNENFISLRCLIHVSPLQLVFQVRGAWFTWIFLPLTFGNKWVYVSLISSTICSMWTPFSDESIYSILKAIECLKNILSNSCIDRIKLLFLKTTRTRFWC